MHRRKRNARRIAAREMHDATHRSWPQSLPFEPPTLGPAITRQSPKTSADLAASVDRNTGQSRHPAGADPLQSPKVEPQLCPFQRPPLSTTWTRLPRKGIRKTFLHENSDASLFPRPAADAHPAANHPTRLHTTGPGRRLHAPPSRPNRQRETPPPQCCRSLRARPFFFNSACADHTARIPQQKTKQKTPSQSPRYERCQKRPD